MEGVRWWDLASPAVNPSDDKTMIEIGTAGSPTTRRGLPPFRSKPLAAASACTKIYRGGNKPQPCKRNEKQIHLRISRMTLPTVAIEPHGKSRRDRCRRQILVSENWILRIVSALSIRVRELRKSPGSFQALAAFVRQFAWCIQGFAAARSVAADV